MAEHTLELRFGAKNVKAWQLAELREKLNAQFDFENNVARYTVDMEQCEVTNEMTGIAHTENVGIIRITATRSSAYNKLLMDRALTEAAGIIRSENAATLH